MQKLTYKDAKHDASDYAFIKSSIGFIEFQFHKYINRHLNDYRYYGIYEPRCYTNGTFLCKV